MPVVSRVRSRGATIVVEAHAEVLFTRTGPVGNFARVFSGRVRSFTSAFAPGNSRPTWGHEPAAHGRPLKSSFMASTRYSPSTMRVFSAVGSTAAYSAFVDQGTGIYNGGSPWLAKVLPPSTEFGSDLYEHTWRFSRGPETVRQVWIKGQKPQFFFARGLEKAFKSMRIPTITVPGTASLGGAVTSFPDDLSNFAGAAIDTGSGGAFMASLERWRAQRDAAWNRGGVLGAKGSAAHTRETERRFNNAANRNRARRRVKPTEAQIRESNRLRQQKFRDHNAKVRGRTINRKPPQQVRSTYRSVAEKKAAALKAFTARNPNVQILRATPSGVLVVVGGRRAVISWGQLYGLL